MTARTRALLAVTAAVVCLLVALIAGLALSIPGPAVADDPSTPTNATGSLERLHAAGVTGENVSVGVIDVTGFDTGHEALAGQVEAARAFGGNGGVANSGRNRHGTAAAAVVARTAPGADLHLAAVDSPADYRRAVTWLVASDVDVIVAPVSFYGTPGDGSALVARYANWATRRGVVFVAPTGNLAGSHWQGRYQGGTVGGIDDGGTNEDDTGDDLLRFGNVTRNYLAGRGGRATVWLSWDPSRAGANFTAELYRHDGNGTVLVARSQPYAADGVPNERIVARLEGGTYYVVVRGPPNATGTRVRLVSPTHRLQSTTAAGSLVAPATGQGVVGVGAYDRSADRVEPYSSRGPTADGRLGVDLVAPSRHAVAGYDAPFVGSSAAAPYAGALAALVLDAEPGLSPRAVEFRLERAAVDVGPGGTDAVSGHGLVRPGRVVTGRIGPGASNATG